MLTALFNGRVMLDAGVVEGRTVLVCDELILDVVRDNDPRCQGGFLPTLISDDLDIVARAVAAVRAAIEAGVPGVLGIHIEGPFLNVERKGVHDPAKLRGLDESWCGLIVDGHHVAPVVMRLALRCKRRDRFMIVTDGMLSIGTDDTSFDLQGRSISVVDGLLLDEKGRLAGSHTHMAHAVRNAVSMLALNLPEAVQMATRNPAAFLGLDQTLGRIAPGYRANLVLADDDLTVEDTWIDGKPLTPGA